MSDSNAGYSFVKVTDLKDYMSGIGLDADQAEASQDVLDGLQRDLERYCQRRFERKERTETLQVDEFGRLWPKATPVISITSPEGYAAGFGNMVNTYPAGTPDGTVFTLSDIGYPGQWIELVYVGGLDPDSDELYDVRLAILRAAAREVTDRHDDTLSVKDSDTRDKQRTDKRVLGFTKEEKAAFDRLRRRTVL